MTFLSFERGNSLLRRLDRYLGIPLVCLLSLPKILKSPGSKVPVLDKLRKIGIFCPGAIGDMLLASALVNGIRNARPEAWLEMISSGANAQALPFMHGINSAISFPVTNIPGIIAHVRKRQYDLFIDLSQWSRLGALVAALSKARLTAGFKTKGQFRHYAYDRQVVHDPGKHETENFMALGKAVFPNFSGKPAILRPEPPDVKQPYICCHMWPGGSGPIYLKEWPAKYWAQLIAVLEKKYKVFLTGSAADHDANSGFKNRYFAKSCAVEVLKPLNLWDTAAFISGSSAAISVNTGIMHLAALLDIPTIGLHGPTNPLRWGPVGKKAIALLPEKGSMAYLNLGFEYPKNAENSLEFLPVEKVLEALKSFGVKIS